MKFPYNLFIGIILIILGFILGIYLSIWFSLLALLGIFYVNFTCELERKGKLKDKEPEFYI